MLVCNQWDHLALEPTLDLCLMVFYLVVSMDRTVFDHILVYLSQAMIIDHHIRNEFQIGYTLIFRNSSLFRNKLKLRMNQIVPTQIILTKILGVAALKILLLVSLDVAAVLVLVVDLVLGTEIIHAKGIFVKSKASAMVRILVTSTATAVELNVNKDHIAAMKLAALVVFGVIVVKTVFLALFTPVDWTCDI